MREVIPLLPLYACRACIGVALPLLLPWRAVTSGMKCGVHCSFCESEISEPSTKDLDIQGLTYAGCFLIELVSTNNGVTMGNRFT